ncbi:hypothetical protein CDV31_003835 [Fusarium ambrosium]|uniref:ABC transporter domain-containing protein n=1 Tax=Fusarium ambrosium TaxID=131363 RepID=A0A428USP5_9HYPO|nr:hypothetical protein CDV31_003835 [Fusarium ambrosium]
MAYNNLLSPPAPTSSPEKPHRDKALPPRELGITWKNLTVQVACADAAIHENVLSQLNPIRTLQRLRRRPTSRTILDNSHGCVKPGEMLLVLGRPGSGCSTLLNVLANQRNGYSSVSGDVHYGSMDATEAKRYRGQIILSSEDEIFFPSLTVGQTMDFAVSLKSPNQHASTKPLQYNSRSLLNAVGIDHTINTKIGNEYIRGVSGGERRRVSIAECLTTQGSIYCWDNSTRGLDASTALEYVKTIRHLTDRSGLSSIMTLYQAGNDIYHLFDKVLILEQGHQIFYGPSKEARPFVENLGFQCREGTNIADFLTGITIDTERIIRPGFELSFPRTAEAIRDKYEESKIFSEAAAEYEYPSTDEGREWTRQFQATIQGEKDVRLPEKSPLTVGFFSQVHACIIRQYQVILGDKLTFWTKQATVLVQALVAGSLFYDAPSTSAGISPRSSAIFFAIMFNTLLAMSEVTDSFSGRPVLAKHRSFALLHPATFCFAQIVSDVPIVLFQISVFSLVLYFMVGLTLSTKSFFIFWAILVSTTMCMTALFRAIGAAFTTFDKATKVSGLAIIASVLYTGFMIPKPDMHPWFVWIYWINPLAYAFNALISNEFSGKTIQCVGVNLLPVGPGYNSSSMGHQSCAGISGAVPGQTFVTGDSYLESFSYSRSDLWRNFGIIWAWWALFVVITVVSTSRWKFSSQSTSKLITPREKKRESREPTPQSGDEESQISGGDTVGGESRQYQVTDAALIRNTSIFTWKDISYVVKTAEGDRKLLDVVYGWVKPGMLGALMGASGAGKTTLLDVLAQRKTEGSIMGSIMVDGRPLPISFQRSAGYCEQFDAHEPYATVREALEFSALLRQGRHVSQEDKLKYVDEIISLLELDDLADALIGTVGEGLSVEQRKRVTIGVELVSKPSILLFLDEPTSGLDGQSAFNIVRFLRRLADLGQAILVTIHQPSAQLLTQFDTLLLLARGGRMAYFGDIGDNADVVKAYFDRNGAPCPSQANPAEHIIDVISGKESERNWAEVWRDSPEHYAAVDQLNLILSDAASKPPATTDDGYEFAQPLWTQIQLVTKHMNIALFRNTEYINNKLILHIFCGLYNGFSFWQLGDSMDDLQLRIFTIFNFIFVAPGVINQLQPLFIERRNLFEARESKSKAYSWIAFVSGLIISETPYLIICGILYFCCWYYTVGFPIAAERAGSTLFVMLMYEFLYTGIGQFIAAYAPNPVFASLINPFVLGVLIMFCGVLVSYEQITSFWRYWLYWLNPFSYIMGSLIAFSSWDLEIHCSDDEYAVFSPPDGTSCGEYLSSYLTMGGVAGNLTNPDDMATCLVCPYRNSNDYCWALNLKEYYYGWRDAGIVALFVLSSYCLVFLLMKLRTKASKTAK